MFRQASVGAGGYLAQHLNVSPCAGRSVVRRSRAGRRCHGDYVRRGQYRASRADRRRNRRDHDMRFDRVLPHAGRQGDRNLWPGRVEGESRVPRRRDGRLDGQAAGSRQFTADRPGQPMPPPIWALLATRMAARAMSSIPTAWCRPATRWAEGSCRMTSPVRSK